MVDADAWVLTETWANFSPGDGYRLVAESTDADDLKAWSDRRWVAIWVKTKLNATKQEVHSQPDRMACAQITKSGHRDVVLIGTVLPWHFDPKWLYPEGFCAALAVQVTEWNRIRGILHSGILSVAGDFNQSLPCKDRIGSKLGESTLTDAFESKLLNLRCVTEGNDPLTGMPRIDHICISAPTSNSQPGAWAIPCIQGKPITDHSGVYVDLKIMELS